MLYTVPSGLLKMNTPKRYYRDAAGGIHVTEEQIFRNTRVPPTEHELKILYAVNENHALEVIWEEWIFLECLLKKNQVGAIPCALEPDNSN